MFDSAKIYRMSDLGFSRAEIEQACKDVTTVNGLSSCYIRPIAFRGFGDVGVRSLGNPDRDLHRVLGVGPVSRFRGAENRR